MPKISKKFAFHLSPPLAPPLRETLAHTEVQRSEEPCAKICMLPCQYAKEYDLGYIDADNKANSTPKIFELKYIKCTLVFWATLLFHREVSMYISADNTKPSMCCTLLSGNVV